MDCALNGRKEYVGAVTPVKESVPRLSLDWIGNEESVEEVKKVHVDG